MLLYLPTLFSYFTNVVKCQITKYKLMAKQHKKKETQATNLIRLINSC